jgi:hypothetical protein
MRESQIEAELKRRVKAARGQTRKVRWLCRSGAPDRVIWWPGPRAAFVEIKRPGEGVDWRSPQGREISRLRADGWAVYVLNEVAQIDGIIDEVRNGA